MSDQSHPEELLDAWRAGRLDAEGEASLHAHARGCVACQLELGVEPGLEDETGPRPEDDAKMMAMVGAAMLDRPGATGNEGTSTSTGASTAARLAWVGAGVAVAGAIVITLLMGGEPNAPQPPAAAAPADASPVADEPAPVGDAAAAPSPEAEMAKPTPERVDSGDAAPNVELSESRDESTHARAPVPSAAQLLREANAQRRAKEFAKADKTYARLAKQHPRSEEEILARVTHGKMLLDHLDRPADALRLFDAYLSARPQGTLAEEALAGRANALGRLGRAAEAQKAWTRLLERFPDSVYADLARRRGGG